MKLIASVLTSMIITSVAFAGTEMTASSGKDSKAVVTTPELVFKDKELQLDIFGLHADGNGNDHAGPLQDHGFGGGLGINYFFTRNLGVGVDGLALYGRENPERDDRGHSLASAKHTTIYGTTGSIIYRLPIESLKLAPYIYAGGGYYSQSKDWAAAHAGLGVEYRIVPQKIGLFADTRYTYFGDRFSNGDQGEIMTKVGIRFVF